MNFSFLICKNCFELNETKQIIFAELDCDLLYLSPFLLPPLILSLPLNLYICITVKRMDQSTCPENSTAVSPAPVQKLGIIPNQNLELKPACQTPEKTNEPSHKIKEGEVKLPDKWAP